MSDDNKQGSIHSSSEGGTVGSYPDPDPTQFLVAPATSSESNAINLNLFLAAYACITDMRFKFDSSFVLPGVQAEMAAFSNLRKKNSLIMGAPISVFGHADPSFQGNFEVGSQFAQSGDDYNKNLSGRRAIAIYAMLIRDPSFWETLYTQHLGTDIWGTDAIQIMLDALGKGFSSFGGSSQGSSTSAQSARAQDIANDSGQRQQLFLQYMNFLCGDLKLNKSADFLARGSGPDLKGDVQGCSRFNPLMLFSTEDEASFKQAFANHDQPTLRGDRDPRNAVNRRVMILIFKKGSQVLPAKWPCPSYKDGTAGCIKRFWSDGDTRRSTHNSDAERKFEDAHDTFACRFYQRISGENSPCNSTSPPPVNPCTTKTFPSQEVDKTITETISNAPAPYQKWNNTYTWQSKFALLVNRSNCSVTATIKIKVTGTVTEAQKSAWKSAIESKWNGKVKLTCPDPSCAAACPSGYQVNVVLLYVTSGEHYTVTANQPGAGGTEGQGGTNGMTGWGVNDTVDVTHEFGHMLGNPEEYFTTNGTDYTDGGKNRGFRDPDGGVMNNPAGNPLPQNYDLIRQQAAAVMGQGVACTTTSA